MKSKIRLIIFIVAIFLITQAITVTATIVTSANNIAYNSDNTNANNIKDSLDELYNITGEKYNQWKKRNKVVYYLGELRSYDIKELISEGKLPDTLDYTNLTNENFISGFDTFPNAKVYKSSGAIWTVSSGKTTGTSVSKNYNSQTGVLEITGGAYELHICLSNQGRYCTDASVKVLANIKTYLIIEPVTN